MNAAELNAKIEQHAKQLATQIDTAGKSEALTRYLNFAASFYRYSMGNQMLIYWQRPDATAVAGYNDWLHRRRFVKKGEKGIAILAPCPVPKDKQQEGKPRIYFKTAYVFDISQTDGEELPQAPEWRSKARHEETHAALIDYARAEGVSVDVIEQTDGAEGRAKKGKEIELAPTAGTLTLAHEIAHILMHQRNDPPAMSAAAKELEAEAVAYIVGQHFGIESEAPNYLALWGIKPDDLREHLTRITRTARQIIEATDPDAKRSQDESPRQQEARAKREAWQQPEAEHAGQ